MSGDELTLEELEDILATPDEPPRQKRTRKKKEDTDDRTIMGWFRLVHSAAFDCDVPAHDEERPRNKGMTFNIDGLNVCRECYLHERDRQE